MILTYRYEFGTPLALNLGDRLAGDVQIDCLEFVNALPIEWRLVDAKGSELTPWTPGYREGQSDALRGLHDLQRPVIIGGDCRTHGVRAVDAVLETRGIGVCNLLVWPREGTYRDRSITVVEQCG